MLHVGIDPAAAGSDAQRLTRIDRTYQRHVVDPAERTSMICQAPVDR